MRSAIYYQESRPKFSAYEKSSSYLLNGLGSSLSILCVLAFTRVYAKVTFFLFSKHSVANSDPKPTPAQKVNKES